jgi:hypothetical protein
MSEPVMKVNLFSMEYINLFRDIGIERNSNHYKKNAPIIGLKLILKNASLYAPLSLISILYLS